MTLLFGEMFYAMARSGLHVGEKLLWGSLFAVTFYIGAFVYYVMVFREEKQVQR